MRSKWTHSIHDQSQIALVVGSNRTGTSLLTEILMQQGFVVPDETDYYIDYKTHESVTFKKLTRNWNEAEARRFVAALPSGKVVLKYPKASRAISRWLRVIRHARVIYVFRPRDEAVASMLKYSRLPGPVKWLARWKYRREWNKGYMAVANLPVPVAFVTFEDLKHSGTFDIPASFGWD